MLTAKELLEVAFSLWYDLKLYKEDNSLHRTMVSSQSQCTETRELEYLITKPLPSNGHLCGTSLTALFRLSGVTSHVTYDYMVL
jgi:hypothetical protein